MLAGSLHLFPSEKRYSSSAVLVVLNRKNKSRLTMITSLNLITVPVLVYIEKLDETEFTHRVWTLGYPKIT
jgi:hypothetical protein